MNIMEQAWRPGLITFLIAFAPACIATPADDGQRAEDADDAAEIGLELPRPGALGTVTPEGVAAAENVLAVVRTANGAEVRFFESAAGELSIESTPPSGGADPLAQLDLDALDATEVYEALAGQPAPEALRTAELRAALSERQGLHLRRPWDGRPEHSPQEARVASSALERGASGGVEAVSLRRALGRPHSAQDQARGEERHWRPVPPGFLVDLAARLNRRERQAGEIGRLPHDDAALAPAARG
ncbi:hypothetical protein [Sorangium sp. So ce363]|uniref:hypothetical protein n=1 Tax=Sorangium sp. So ce363 TaxID=3133304 RepID=UPI003F5DC1A5